MLTKEEKHLQKYIIKIGRLMKKHPEYKPKLYAYGRRNGKSLTCFKQLLDIMYNDLRSLK